MPSPSQSPDHLSRLSAERQHTGLGGRILGRVDGCGILQQLQHVSAHRGNSTRGRHHAFDVRAREAAAVRRTEQLSFRDVHGTNSDGGYSPGLVGEPGKKEILDMIKL